MNKELIEAIPQWEREYLRMSKNLTDREKEILKGDLIKSNEVAKVLVTGLTNGIPNSTAPQNCVRCRKSVSNSVKTAPTLHIS